KKKPNKTARKVNEAVTLTAGKVLTITSHHRTEIIQSHQQTASPRHLCLNIYLISTKSPGFGLKE
ncbi:hypothetical protein, partial [Endozoicomonas sp. SESOKO2]|uniref:hypothetical protein n=1 Tax=Endozoicomonas sp. SESOKO2 TaxID=2828743 RepID=UPI0021478070